MPGLFPHLQFPHLQPGSYEVTSPPDSRYNCIAWAAGDDSRWWWPGPYITGGYYWPSQVPATETVDSFVQAFELLGYHLTNDGQLESAVEKIAIYADTQGRPKHVARQLSNGKWTSKLGFADDIWHDTEREVEGPAYGTVAVYMARQSVTNRVEGGPD